jgi:imidazolonepropionase-like amidohydrolase
MIIAGTLLAAIAAAPPDPAVALENVAIVSVLDERIHRGRTVLIRDGRIERVGPAGRVPLPEGTRRVDATGKFLVPGLIDMHVHLLSDGALPDSLAPDELMILVANGITTARLMIGTPEHLALRRSVAAGEIVGPSLAVGSPQLSGRSFGDPFNGRVVTTEAAAREAVREAKRIGYDFIKITFFITRPVYDAVVDEAKLQRIRVVGHVDPDVGLTRAFETGQQIEHLDGMLEAVLADSSPTRSSVSGVQVWSARNWGSLDYIDDRKVAAVARAAKTAGVWVTPTLFFLKMAFGEGETDAAIEARPDWRFLPPAVKREMAGPRKAFWSNPPTEPRRRRYVLTRNRLAEALDRAGVPLMAGSDAPEWNHLYGWMYHRELESLGLAGLGPWAVLRAATVTPARWLGRDREIGTVEPGKVADLVLLEGNPIDDIRNTARIAGVARAGRWLDRADLDRELERIAARLATALP